ncbi:MAG: class I SAM-dependent methyltransferase [Actinomycetota bacterium]|nr:class I SAM-dependent methyltransferase [Actinomycetota bacterium]
MEIPPAAGRVLDAGCGSGGNLGAYTRFGPVMGVDSDVQALDHARGRGFQGAAAASLLALPFRANAFDLTCATDVIEHVADDIGALVELRRVTMSGGYLLVTVPAYQWLWSDGDVQLGHQRRYRAAEIAQRCRAAGWTVVQSSYFNTALLPPIAAVRWARRRRSGSFAATELEQTGPWANRLLRLPMQFEARLVAAGVRLPTGVSIVVLCRR